jgi:hypothetical protein
MSNQDKNEPTVAESSVNESVKQNHSVRQPNKQNRGKRLSSGKPYNSPSKNSRQSEDNKNKEPRHGGTGFDKIKLPTSANIAPKSTYRIAYAGNHGLERFVPIAYQAMISKDWKLANIIQLEQLQYVTSCALLNRLHQISIRCGSTQPQHTKMLKDVCSGIRLPDIIARFVESFGIYTTRNGVSLIPWIGATFEEHIASGQSIMIDHRRYLHRAQRNVPINPWYIDEDWIIKFNMSSARVQTSGMSYREVDNSVLDGTSAMITSFLDDDSSIVAYSSEQSLEPEVKLAACYSLRNRRHQDEWPGEANHLITDDFLTTSYNPSIFIADILVEAFKPKPFGTR